MKKKKRWLLGRMIPKAIGGVSGRGREGGSGSDIAVQQKALKAMLSALLAADEPKCIALYMAENKAGISLQYEMQPSLPLGNDENTPMHYAAAGFMPGLLSRFIEHGGSPNTLNAMNQTCIHLACGGFQSSGSSGQGESCAPQTQAPQSPPSYRRCRRRTPPCMHTRSDSSPRLLQQVSVLAAWSTRWPA
jgi:hypothetical protein